MTPHIVWALAAVAIAVLAFLAFWKWLERERDSDAKMLALIAEHQKSIERRDSEWLVAFTNLERGYMKDYEDVRQRVNAVTPQMNPLGSSYTTRPMRPGPS